MHTKTFFFKCNIYGLRNDAVSSADYLSWKEMRFKSNVPPRRNVRRLANVHEWEIERDVLYDLDLFRWRPWIMWQWHDLVRQLLLSYGIRCAKDSLDVTLILLSTVKLSLFEPCWHMGGKGYSYTHVNLGTRCICCWVCPWVFWRLKIFPAENWTPDRPCTNYNIPAPPWSYYGCITAGLWDEGAQW